MTAGSQVHLPKISRVGLRHGKKQRKTSNVGWVFEDSIGGRRDAFVEPSYEADLIFCGEFEAVF